MYYQGEKTKLPKKLLQGKACGSDMVHRYLLNISGCTRNQITGHWNKIIVTALFRLGWPKEGYVLFRK